MLEYLNFFFLCVIFASILYLYIQIKKYFPILKMAEELIDNLGYGAPQSDTKCQKLLECILTGNSKLYLGKVYIEEQLAKLSEEEVEKLFNNYEAKLSGQMVKSLGKSIFNMYSMGACSVLVQAAVISVLAVAYSMLGKKILKMTPPSIQTFDLEDTGKLVATVATSEMTREYFIKQKILPDHVNV